ncbi:hypothetical protein HRbin19_00088 [bacterium HR19]|nr:hypothetical protein HRbin19_00088 [bacterium HR19]
MKRVDMKTLFIFFNLSAFMLFLFFSPSCNKNKQNAQKNFFLEISPQEGVYPEYSTLYISVRVRGKDAELCYTVREKDNPKPCEREYVKRVKVSADNSVTIPATPEFTEGATEGVFHIKILAKSKDGEEILESRRYKIILKPFITVNPRGGFYSKDITVAVGCNKPCFLYYTLDGSNPVEKGKKEENGFIIDVKNDIKLQVYAEDKVLGLKSDIRTEEYFIDKSPPETIVLGTETCKCEKGCDKKVPDVVRCKNAVTLSLIGNDDKSPSIDVFWSVDGFDPSDEVEKSFEAGGNTFRAKNSGQVPVKTHTIVKFFSKDLAGNKENIRTLIVLIGDRPFAYAIPPGGVFGSSQIPLEVQIFSIPDDALISYTVSYPDSSTYTSTDCPSPCKIVLEKEGKNIITFRAYKGGLADEQRRADFIIDKTPPRVFFEPANCFSDSGPISATIKADEEKVKVFWKICEKDLPGCSLPSCDPNSPDVLSGTAPVTNIVIDIPSFVFVCGRDLAGNTSEVIKTECEVSGKYIEEFDNQDKMDSNETTASWGNGKLTLKRDSPSSEGSVDTQGAGTRDIDVRDKTAFIIDANSGVKVIDISSPSAPGVVAQLGLTSAISLSLWHDVLFVLTNSKIFAYDISNVRNIKQIGSVDLSSDLSISPNQANNIRVWGKYLIISAGNQGVVLVKVRRDQTTSTHSVAFERVGGIMPSSNASGVSSQDIDVFGNLVAVAEGRGGLRILSVQNPSAPSQLTSVSDFLSSGESAQSVKFFFPYVVVGTNNGGIYIFDSLNPKKTKQIASFTVSSGIPINDIDVWGNILIISDNQGIKFIDVRDPSNPSVVYDLRRGGTLSSFVYGDRLLAGDINSGLYIYKIAEPYEKPYEVSVLDTGSAYASCDGFIASTAGGDRAKFFTISDPFTPSSITGVSGSDLSSLLVWGTKLIVGDGSKIKFFDFPPTDPIKEIDLSSLKSGVRVRKILGWGDTAIVAGESALFLVPLSQIADLTPDKIFKYEKSGISFYDIDISGDTLFVSSRDSRVIVLRISEGPNITLLLDNLVSSAVWGSIYFGKYLAVAEGISGLIYYDVSQLIFSRIAQIGALPVQNAIGVKNFGYFDLVFRDTSLSLADNTYIDRPREVYSASLKVKNGSVFGDLAVVYDGDGKAKIIRFARGKTLYLSEGKAQSTNLTPDLKSSIKDASISVSYCETQDINCDKVGCNVSFQLTNNGGLSWVEVIPNAGFFPFNSTGTSLMWRANLKTGDPTITPEICRIIINYRFGR